MFAKLKRIAPRRGWRAFIGEVGVIVLGVLIAVGIGKLVEAIDWRDRVAQTRASLHDDLAYSYFAAVERVSVTPCLMRQLERLRARVLDRAATTPVPRYDAGARTRIVYVHPVRNWSAHAWQAAVADNVPAHMERDERDAFQQYYAALQVASGWNSREAEDSSDLSILAEPVRLDERARIELLRTIERARLHAGLLNLLSRQQLRNLQRMGWRYRLNANERAQMNTMRWCRDHDLL